jgi:hypothetical protein
MWPHTADRGLARRPRPNFIARRSLWTDHLTCWPSGTSRVNRSLNRWRELRLHRPRRRRITDPSAAAPEHTIEGPDHPCRGK